MSPGSRYENGFGPPIDDDEFFEEHPEDDESSRGGDSEEQILKDGNNFILKQLDAKNFSRQYSKTQALKSTKISNSAMTLDGVDWSGFSGKAHKTGKGKPGSSKRLRAARMAPNEEILEVTSSVGRLNTASDSHDCKPRSEGSMRLSSRRRHLLGKFQSRRASAKQLLNNSADFSASLDDMKCEPTSKERRTRTSSKERRPRKKSRPRRIDSLGGSNHGGSSQRSRRNLRSRANSGELNTGENTEDRSRPRRSRSKRSNARDGEVLVSPSGRARSPRTLNRMARSERGQSPRTLNRMSRSERGQSAQTPRRQKSLGVSKAVSNENNKKNKTPSKTPRSEPQPSHHNPRKHNSAGVLGTRSSRRAGNGRSISPGDARASTSRRGNSQSPGRSLAAASSTTLEVSIRKAPRTRRGSNGDPPGLTTNPGSIKW